MADLLIADLPMLATMTSEPAPDIEALDEIYIFPMSYAQQRLWFLDQLEPGGTAYNMPVVVRLTGRLKQAALTQALQSIVERHEVLRTTFDLVDGEPGQVVAPYLALDLPLVDLQHAPDARQMSAVTELAAQEAQRPFNLVHGPLLRASLIRLQPDDHVLLITLHHIVSDGWSMRVLINELGALYAAFVTDAASPLPSLPIQYADFSCWQREWLQGAVLEEQLHFWKEQLSGAPALLELPTDFPRPPVQSLYGARHSFTLPADLSRGIKQLALQTGSTLFMTLLAAYNVLLARYSNQSDIVVGTPIANRHRQELEPLIGFFVNTLVLRTRLNDNPPFTDLLQQVRQTMLTAHHYQDLPFELLVDALQPTRNLSHSPLFQVMFVWQNTQALTTAHSAALAGLQITSLEVENSTAKFDLTLFMDEGAQGIAGVWEYNTDLFTPATIERLAGHFQTLLESIVTDPTQRVGRLTLLTPAERQHLLVELNQTITPYPHDLCIHQWFEAQAARTPDEIAIVFVNHTEIERLREWKIPPHSQSLNLSIPQSLTYGELNARANQLAHYLQTQGVGPEVLVGVCCERSVELMMGILGVLKAGGAYVPVDPAYPRERIAFMLEDAQVKLLLTQQKLTRELPPLAPMLCLDRAWGEVASGPTHNPVNSAQPDNLAYVIYTSGSTGRPKGAQIIHRGLMNYLAWALEAYKVAEGRGAPVHSSIGFDATITSFFAPLLAGKKVVMLPEKDEIEALGALLQSDDHYSLVKITPAHMEALSHLLPEAAATEGANAFVIGGEALFGKHLTFWQKYAPRTRMINEYGPTETVVGCCVYEALPGVEYAGAVPIGRPIANTQLYVLDAYQQPTPFGVPGELYIGGDGVARGYLNRPDLTAERFIQNPFGPGRLYKTGDLVRYLSDGNLVYLGRLDHQVKIRGFRIELGEIEAVLTQHDEVQEAVVLVDEQYGYKRLVAYVVVGGPTTDDRRPTTDDRGQTTEDSGWWSVVGRQSSVESHATRNSQFAIRLRHFLQARLPDYMIPAVIIPVAAMPLTTNGKVDRRALPAPQIGEAPNSTNFVAPRTPLETTLVEIWRAVLRAEQVGIHDNFFELGGDSILSIQVVSRARQAGIQLTPKQLFQQQTVAGLAGVVALTPVQQAEQGLSTGSAPLTPIQHWFFAQERLEAHHYNQSVMLKVTPALTPTLLEQALHHLLRHHDALRLRFEETPAGWQQTHAALEDRVPLSVIDLTDTPVAAQRRRIEAAASELQASLDLTNGPLLRAALIHLGAGKPGRLLIVIHHLAVDGVSWRILLEDLTTACQQLQQGQLVQFPAKTSSFQAWGRQLVEYAQSPMLEKEAAHWLAQTVSAPTLPLDYPDATAANTVASAANFTISLSAEQTRALLQVAPAAYHTQINDLLLTALAQTLSRWANASTLVLDLESHGRADIFPQIDLSRTVGWFTTIYPVQLTVTDQQPGAAIKAIKEQLRQVPNQGLGYGVLRYLRQDPQLLQAPLAQVKFNYLGQLDQSLQQAQTGGIILGLASEAAGLEHSPRAQRTHWLDVNAIVLDDRLQVSWGYSANLHQAATIERLAHRFIDKLAGLIDHCQSPQAGGYTPSDFPLATLDQTTLDRLVGNGRAVEDLYALSPMQQGMLFHTLLAPTSGVYFEQMSTRLHGPLDADRFRRAWQATVDAHAILRTGFHWEGLEEPVQLVRYAVALPWQQEDWQGSPSQEQVEHLDTLLQTERAQGFDLRQAPLIRCCLVQLAPETYQFVWSHHHLLLDGWGRPLLLQEVLARYAGDAPTMNTPPYRNYIAWLQQQDKAQAAAYWRQALQGVSAPTPLMVDRPAQNGVATSYAELAFPLDESITAALQTLARQHHLTLNSFVQGAWALLLSRYSGQSDLLFGATVSGRPPTLPGVEAMLGLFINTLPVRVQVNEEERLLPWLQTLQTQQAERTQFAYTPLVDIHGWSEIPRSIPLFESLLVFENYPIEEMQPARAGITIGQTHSFEQTNYPLTLVAAPGRELWLALSYDRQRFDEATIQRMGRHLQTLLAGMATTPEQRLVDLPLLTAAEEQQLLVDWNATQRTYPQAAGRCVHELFAEQAARTPEAVALVFGEQQLTYAALNQRANQLAHYIQQHFGKLSDPTSPGELVEPPLVGVCMERSLEMLISVWAVLKAGAAYVPLDPTYPPERLSMLIADAQVNLVLTQQKHLEQLPADVSAICVEMNSTSPDWQAITAQHISNPPNQATPDTLAYLIYTSGSTGKPKGVLIPHRALVEHCYAMIDAYRLGPGEAALLFANLSFDQSVEDIFPTQLSGAKLVVRPPDAVLSLADLLAVAERERLTVLNIPTAYWQEWTLNLAQHPLPTRLRLVVVGGETVPLEPLRRWQEFVRPGVQWCNGYGPTEATVTATLYKTNGPIDPIARSVPIGRPLANTQVYLLDAYMRPVPIGVPGELYIGGVRVARGYKDRPELTAEKFIANPFGSDRLYKTGDLARYLANGAIEFMGRQDQQVKIRGYRIELGEIEAALNQHPAVRTSVVVARTDIGVKRLVAYLVAGEAAGGEGARGEGQEAVEAQLATRNSQLTTRNSPDLRPFLQERLPEYMIPAAFVWLDALPLTSSGKIDRRALPAPEANRHVDSYVAPRDAAEQRLAALWAEVLGIPAVGIHDNFFELGGHSLLAVRLMAALQQAVGQNLSLSTLFEQPTVAELASRIRQIGSANSWAPLVALQPHGSKTPFFCVHGGGGNLLHYYGLARALGADQPFYGLQAVGLDGKSKPFAQMEAMAAHYIAAIQSVQPHGPYLLGGHSFGGHVAYEMAQQLQRAGEPVALVAIMDTFAPGAEAEPVGAGWDDAQWLLALTETIERFFGVDLQLDATTLRPLNLADQLSYVRQRLEAANLLPPTSDEREDNSLLRGLYQVFRANNTICYTPQTVIPTPLTLFRAQAAAHNADHTTLGQDPTWGWQPFAAGAVNLQWIPGDHIAMLAAPNVQQLAMRLARCLEVI